MIAYHSILLHITGTKPHIINRWKQYKTIEDALAAGRVYIYKYSGDPERNFDRTPGNWKGLVYEVSGGQGAPDFKNVGMCFKPVAEV